MPSGNAHLTRSISEFYVGSPPQMHPVFVRALKSRRCHRNLITSLNCVPSVDEWGELSLCSATRLPIYPVRWLDGKQRNCLSISHLHFIDDAAPFEYQERIKLWVPKAKGTFLPWRIYSHDFKNVNAHAKSLTCLACCLCLWNISLETVCFFSSKG